MTASLVFREATQHSVHPTSGRAPGLSWWESARFQAVCVAWSWFRQVALARPAQPPVTPAIRQPVAKIIRFWLETIMEKKQISNLETAGVGCLVSVGLLVLGVLILPASGYFFFCVIRYIILAFPLSLVGAFIGKMITELRMGVWLGAMVLLILGFAWLFSSPNYYSCVLSD